MTYLLAKYTLLFLLTAVSGFVLGYWFSRRNIEDVSESFEDLRRANARSDESQWNRLWTAFDSIPAPKDTDLTSVYERLDGVANSVANLPKPESVNFAPVESRLDKLETEIKAIPVPEKPAPVNLAPITGKLDSLDAAVRNIPKPEPQRAVDLGPVQSELSTLRRQIKEIPAVETHAPADLEPVIAQIRALDQRVTAIARPQTVDLKPIDQRLRAIETELGRLRKRQAKPERVATKPARIAAESRKVARNEPRILKAALYGKKDDLKLISGVGPKLERLLNKNGVYYFWQVASWNHQDINVIDERLDVFKGRISRDNWVNQAKSLRREPGAAQIPADA